VSKALPHSKQAEESAASQEHDAVAATLQAQVRRKFCALKVLLLPWGMDPDGALKRRKYCPYLGVVQNCVQR